jgi:hypothetical protein
MHVLKHVGLGMGLFAASLVIGSWRTSPAMAAPPPTQVEVINQPTVSITGTPSVNIASLPAGPLNIAGSVGISPGATILADPSQTAPLAPAPASSAGYTGALTGGKKALVVQSATDGQEPFAVTVSFNCGPGPFGCPGTSALFGHVPAQKRAVIEHINAYIHVGTGDHPLAQVTFSAPDMNGTVGLPTNEYLPLTLTTTSPVLGDQYIASIPTRLYAESPQSVFAAVGDAYGEVLSGMTAVFTLTGYLVDTP